MKGTRINGLVVVLALVTAAASADRIASAAARAKPRPELSAALLGAASRGDTAAVKSLLARGADPNVRNFLQITPLMIGAMLGDLPMVRSLLTAGAKRNATSLFGSALTFAAQSGNEPVFLHLLNGGADVSVDRPDRITVLMLAARADRPASVRALLTKKLALDPQDNNGATALIHAARAGSVSAARVLLQNGASVGTADQQGWTALTHAAVNGHTELVALLLKKGAKPDDRDAGGCTALLLTASHGDHPATVRALLDGGAAIDVRDDRERTALALATSRGHSATARLLRERDASAIPTPAGTTSRSAREAVAASLPLLERSMRLFAERTGCGSCHHEGLGRIVTGLARERGLPIDGALATMQAKRVAGFFTERSAPFTRAVKDPATLRLISEDSIGELTPISGFLLAGMAAHGYPADGVLATEAVVLGRQQSAEGPWTFDIPRVPMQSSRFAMTALAIRSLRAYAPPKNAAETRTRLRRAKAWLLSARASDTEDRAMRLLGLQWAGASRGERSAALQALRGAQRADGGWGQRDAMPSDAYATGQALYALAEGGEVPATDAAFQRGVAFLLRTQEEEGSWFVNKRAMPLNNYFDAGFPHGQSQYSAFNATCWATMALLQTVEPERPATRTANQAKR